jgi:hypothetical protein
VPFIEDASTMASMRCMSGSMGSIFRKIFAVISTRYDLSSPVFHSSNTSASSRFERPSVARMLYASAMSSMSAYSMPLWTIFT